MMKVEELAELIRTAAPDARYLDLNPKLVRKSLLRIETAGTYEGLDVPLSDRTGLITDDTNSGEDDAA